MRTRTTAAENRKVQLSFRDRLDQHIYHYDYGGSILEFEHNPLLDYKRINSVKLHFSYNSSVDNATDQLLVYLNSGTLNTRDSHWHEYVYRYSSNKSLAEINLQNFEREGNCFLESYEDLHNIIPTSVTYYEREIDVDYHIVNGKIRYLISAGQNILEADHPDVYDSIYGAANIFCSEMQPNDLYYNKYINRSTAYLEVDYSNIPPSTPTPLSPININYVANEPIPFTWDYSSPVSSPQASATIEYKLSSASTWTTVTSSGAGTTYTLNAGLPAGTYQWRVKVTDGQGETSDYSVIKEFNVIAQPEPTPNYPVDTGLPAYAPIAFSWTFNKPSPASSATQAAAKLQYRERGSNLWIDVTVSGSSTTYTLQAGLTVGQYEWRVQVTNNYSETSSYCNIVYFQIVAQSAPTPTSPGDNITLFEGHDITFTWIYNSLTPATQASATIKYRVVGGSTWTTYTSASANPFCTISDIPQGQYEWGLNITNNYGETSADSSTLEFNIIGRPQRPIILTPDNCCLTTISWNASGQEAAEFILMQGDNVIIHETVATAVTSYKPQIFLKGTYKAMARIKNNSDLWSDYGELEFTIDAAEPDPGNLIAMPFDTEIHLEGTYTSTNVAIVRIDEDGTETVLAMDDHAIDKKVAGGTEYAYVLRSWNTGGYIDTPAKVFDFKFEGAILSTETEELHLDRSEQKFLAHDEEIERQYAQMRYVGREFAVIERGEYTEQTLSKQFHVTKEQRRILDRLAKEKALFYRDSRGNAFKAAILGVSYNGYMGNDYIASIRLTRTAADEVIINV